MVLTELTVIVTTSVFGLTPTYRRVMWFHRWISQRGFREFAAGYPFAFTRAVLRKVFRWMRPIAVLVAPRMDRAAMLARRARVSGLGRERIVSVVAAWRRLARHAAGPALSQSRPALRPATWRPLAGTRRGGTGSLGLRLSRAVALPAREAWQARRTAWQAKRWPMPPLKVPRPLARPAALGAAARRGRAMASLKLGSQLIRSALRGRSPFRQRFYVGGYR